MTATDTLSANLSLLVVDDEPAMRSLLNQALTNAGHMVKDAADGKAALAVLEQNPIDLVITDLRMEGLSGIDLLREIRERHPQTAVMLITGFATLESAMDAMRLGAIDMIQKPVNIEELARKVATHAERRRRVVPVQSVNQNEGAINVDKEQTSAAHEAVVEARPAELPAMKPNAGPGVSDSIDKILDIPVLATVQLGKTTLQIADLLKLNAGSVIELDAHAGDPVELLVNDRPIALGEVVVVNDTLGIRVTSVLDTKQRIRSLS